MRMVIEHAADGSRRQLQRPGQFLDGVFPRMFYFFHSEGIPLKSFPVILYLERISNNVYNPSGRNIGRRDGEMKITSRRDAILVEGDHKQSFLNITKR